MMNYVKVVWILFSKFYFCVIFFIYYLLSALVQTELRIRPYNERFWTKQVDRHYLNYLTITRSDPQRYSQTHGNSQTQIWKDEIEKYLRNDENKLIEKLKLGRCRLKETERNPQIQFQKHYENQFVFNSFIRMFFVCLWFCF